MRFAISPKLTASVRRWRWICLLVGLALGGWGLGGVFGLPVPWVGLLFACAALSFMSSLRLHRYARDLEDGIHDLVISHDAVRVAGWRIEISRDRLVSVEQKRSFWTIPVWLWLRVSDRRRPYRVDLGRFARGDEIAAVIERWRQGA